jgi:DNA-binding IclR family transcriptional regulator
MPVNPAPVKSVETTFRVISALRSLGGAGPSEVSNYIDTPQSTVHDHLRTLESCEYVTFDGNDYRIGPRFLELGGYARSRMKLHQVGASELQKLATETGEHANSMIEDHGFGIFLDKSKGQDAVKLDTHVGMRVHLQSTALGKAILAHTPRERVERILDKHGLPQITENTITDRQELFDEFETVRERGVAIDDEERISGIWCIGAPIKSDGRVLGAVSVSGPASRMKNEQFSDEVADMVRSTANVIEVNSTHS